MNELIHVGFRTHLEASDIVMLEGNINYTFLYLADGRKIIVPYHLKKLSTRLVMHKSFVRPNKSAIVNLQFLTEYNDNSLTINQEIIRISRRRKEEIISNCKDFMTNKG
jgi:DNA-binding LytR/AlgR family response regulator